MTDLSRGRHAPTPPKPYPGKAPEPAGAYSWNKPRDTGAVAVDRNPVMIPYRNTAGELRQADGFALFGQRYARDSESKLLRKRLQSMPQYIRRYYAQRLNDIEEKQGNKKASEWLKNSFGRFVLPRVDKVNAKYLPADVMPGALIGFKDDFHRIPWSGKRDLKKLAYRLADALTTELMRECEHQVEATGNYEFAILSGYGRAAWLMTHLNMTAPGWQQYCDEELTAEDALRAAARIESPTWWLRRLRRMYDQWREHLMIATGYVHKKAMPYSSEPCVKEWLAQKKANREYINAMELEEQDTGERVSLADKVNGSIANPAIRRAELMVRMRGFEDVAKAEGYVGAFFTITAPSKYHSMNSSGLRNGKYNGASPRETQRYLCKVWSRVRAKWKREEIRTFGFRVTEAHHDGTPHWHALLFFKPDDLDTATDYFHEYALQEDGGEKGAAEARFEMKPIDESFGSATGYIAKYISKNIDGYALDGEKDDETGEDLKDMSKRISAWASRWNIRQFQQIGGAPVTVYRELRRLRDRELFLFPEISPAHIAADAGDWAGYITAQGGPLVEREQLRVRLSYEVTENGNDYGDTVSHVNGVYSPLAWEHAVVFTRTSTYKIVPQRKADAGESVDLSGGIAAPRSSVNNCTREPLTPVNQPVSSTVKSDRGRWPGAADHAVPHAVVEKEEVSRWAGVDFQNMTRKERREFSGFLIAQAKNSKKPAVDRDVSPPDMAHVSRIEDFARSCGMGLTDLEVKKLASGEVVSLAGTRWRALADGTLRRDGRAEAEIKSSLLGRVYNLANMSRKG